MVPVEANKKPMPSQTSEPVASNAICMPNPRPSITNSSLSRIINGDCLLATLERNASSVSCASSDASIESSIGSEIISDIEIFTVKNNNITMAYAPCATLAFIEPELVSVVNAEKPRRRISMIKTETSSGSMFDGYYKLSPYGESLNDSFLPFGAMRMCSEDPDSDYTQAISHLRRRFSGTIPSPLGREMTTKSLSRSKSMHDLKIAPILEDAKDDMGQAVPCQTSTLKRQPRTRTRRPNPRSSKQETAQVINTIQSSAALSDVAAEAPLKLDPTAMAPVVFPRTPMRPPSPPRPRPRPPSKRDSIVVYTPEHLLQKTTRRSRLLSLLTVGDSHRTPSPLGPYVRDPQQSPKRQYRISNSLQLSNIATQKTLVIVSDIKLENKSRPLKQQVLIGNLISLILNLEQRDENEVRLRGYIRHDRESGRSGRRRRRRRPSSQQKGSLQKTAMSHKDLIRMHMEEEEDGIIQERRSRFEMEQDEQDERPLGVIFGSAAGSLI